MIFPANIYHLQGDVSWEIARYIKCTPTWSIRRGTICIITAACNTLVHCVPYNCETSISFRCIQSLDKMTTHVRMFCKQIKCTYKRISCMNLLSVISDCLSCSTYIRTHSLNIVILQGVSILHSIKHTYIISTCISIKTLRCLLKACQAMRTFVPWLLLGFHPPQRVFHHYGGWSRHRAYIAGFLKGSS